jgi:hypothetical protein
MSEQDRDPQRVDPTPAGVGLGLELKYNGKEIDITGYADSASD